MKKQLLIAALFAMPLGAWAQSMTMLPESRSITIEAYGEPNVFITNSQGQASQTYVEEGGSLSIDDADQSLEITEEIPNVNVTYTRDAIQGVWQGWYMPFNVDYADMSANYDVAQIQGVMVDGKGDSYVGFLKINDGVVKAHTPYVIRAKQIGSIVLNTTATLQPTDSAKSFAIQTATHNFTFGGVYEKSLLSAEYPTYALTKSGVFSLMGESVYLRPFRIFMRIANRKDSPYATAATPQEVKIVVFGDEETGINDVDADVDVEGKFLVNGKIVIMKNNVKYNVAGQMIK